DLRQDVAVVGGHFEVDALEKLVWGKSRPVGEDASARDGRAEEQHRTAVPVVRAFLARAGAVLREAPAELAHDLNGVTRGATRRRGHVVVEGGQAGGQV